MRLNWSVRKTLTTSVHPAEYKWSSYRANAQGERNTILTPHLLYSSLGSSESARNRVYRELFRNELDPDLVDEIRTATNGNYALGSPRFQEEVAAMLKRRVTPGKSGRPRKQHNRGNG
jgi:putative transposase